MSSRCARRLQAAFFIGPILECIAWRHHFEQIGVNALEVVAHQIFQFQFPWGGEVFGPFEKAPARLRQDRFVPVPDHSFGLRGSDVIPVPFPLATMWNRSRICNAWEHFSRITRKYGFHMSDQANSIFADNSLPGKSCRTKPIKSAFAFTRTTAKSTLMKDIRL